MMFKEIIHKSKMAPRGLRHKLWATFALSSVIPLLLFVYLLQEYAFRFYPRISISSSWGFLNQIFKILPMEKFPGEISWMIAAAIALSLVGLYFTKNIIDRILKLTNEARSVVQQTNFTQEIRVMSEDEIGELRDTLNFVIARLQQNMQELGEYEKRLVVSEKEKHQLLQKTRNLTIRDEVTGLYNAQYFQERWKEEIRRATLFQRPCGLIVLSFHNMQTFEETEGIEKKDFIIKGLAGLIKGALKGIERLAYIHPADFMIILPEKNKKEALVLAELIIKILERYISQEKLNLAVNGGIVSSPLDGVESAELVHKVKEASLRAYKESPGKILGF